ncbi:fumarylacetoacetate hydrolase family protein [Massilia horti]|uniref:FAA hydrolase family protein n=1 Tax=Massilia horti TaxID=2562153 RepID=A0A4Y9T0V4_9BURK|nr:fumarylacetoacetate hydrolase family protein [Massilia horti]TFW32902.1 FAA hydrolase family protein [Massilia horti]
MKLASYRVDGRDSFGIVDGQHVYDLGKRLGPATPDLCAAIAQNALKQFASLPGSVTPDYAFDQLTLLPVIPNPGKIVCVGVNYLAHREEVNRPATEHPTLFLRVAESQAAHGQALLCPAESDEFDFEGEVALVIGRAGNRIAEADALSYIAGFSCYNDGSVRDWQAATSQWTAGKNFRQTGAFGPWLVTADELPPEQPMRIATRLNGVEVQKSSTDLLIFGMARLISFISSITPLSPGDVIVTGTPGGVGFKRVPKLFMKDGDVVEVEVSGIGVLRNPVRKERLAG